MWGNLAARCPQAQRDRNVSPEYERRGMRETQQTGFLEAARPQGGAFRQGNHLFFIAPLIPAHKAGIAGCAPGQQPGIILSQFPEYGKEAIFTVHQVDVSFLLPIKVPFLTNIRDVSQKLKNS
jgi:hypothetical protein